MESSPVDRAGALALARGARRILVKVGQDTLRFDASRPMTEGEVERYLLHEDGLLRIPVLVWGDLLVRGYTEDLYAEALAGREPPQGVEP